MIEKLGESRGIPRFPLNPFLVAGSAMAGLAFVSSASAQYVFDPGNANEQSGRIKYFGATKEDQGALLLDGTIL